MNRLLFVTVMAVVYPLSRLPFSILYAVSDFIYFFLYYVLRYRKNVVFANLRHSFPEKSGREIHEIAKKFYGNLCDIIVENIKMTTISETEVIKRCSIKNIELLNEYHRQGKSVIATIGHCGNWELAGLATSLAVKHRSIAFYRAMKNPYFDRFARNLRGKFGMHLLPHTQALRMLKEEGRQPNLYIFITDQAPANSKTSYWTTFLHQDTAIYRGAEKTARLTGHPLVYGDIQRVKRGFYSIEVIPLCDKPSATPEGELTEMHTRTLEKAIIRHPDNWLWTHRRWKRKR